MRVRQAFRVALYHLSGLVPRSRRRVLFGSWHGHRYSDNPRYLFEHLVATRPDLRLTWCGHHHVATDLPDAANVAFVRRGTVGAAWALLRAGTVFVSHGPEDVGGLNLTRGATVVYLGHGLAIKRMGPRTARPAPVNRLASWAQRTWRAAEGCTFFVASSPVHEQKLVEEFHSLGCRDDNTLLLGQPRCDVFVEHAARGGPARLRERLARTHSVAADRRLVVYMPTFRDNHARTFSFATLGEPAASRLRAVLDRHDAVLVERSHFVDGVLRREVGGDAPNVVDLSGAGDVDSNELLLAADALITDYSGAYVDFLLLDRPVLHFVYDRDEYLTRDRGLYFDLDEIAGGPLVTDVDELLAALDLHLAEPDRDAARRRRVRELLLADERGHSRHAVAQRFLPGGHAGTR